MRIKALLCCAALAAGIATSMAQSNVYSLNIVGYVNTPIAVGFNLIANPLDNGTNDLNSLFPTANLGDQIFLYRNGAFANSTFITSWSPLTGQTTDPILVPGEGIFYQNTGTAPYTNTFVGNVMTGNLSNPIPPGFSLRASQAPVADTPGNLGIPGNLGDQIFAYRGGQYQNSTYITAWSDLTPPAIGIGEAFWINNTGSTTENWTRSFNP